MTIKTKFILLLVVSLIAIPEAFAQKKKPDPKFFIYLCFGQSNMEAGARPEKQDSTSVDARFQMLAAVDNPKLNRKMGTWYVAEPPINRPENNMGPVDWFGRTMVANLPAEYRVGVINVSVAGAKIELWGKDSYKTYLDGERKWMQDICKQYNDNPYQRLIDMAKIAQQDGVIKGILLHQGESNSTDPEWPNKVKVIYNNLMMDLKLKPKNVPLLAGELKSKEEHGVCYAFNTDIMPNLPKVLPNAYIISSQGVKGTPDQFHFNTQGMREFGRRYAIKMLELQGFPYSENKGPKPSAVSYQAQNPLIHADVPDMSMIRVGDTYYMSSTTMHMSPGVPVMKSKDLVNWQLVSYAYDTLANMDATNLTNGKSMYGKGSWASSIRYVKDTYYISTFAQTTNQTYIFSTKDIEKGPWKVNSFKPSLHDNTIFFDDDGRIYLIWGAGKLTIAEVKEDLSGLKEGSERVLIENASAPAGPNIMLNSEGSQLFKVGGKYYLFNICWPRGGMRTVIIHRADQITGPWEGRVALQDLGVAQGGLIDMPDGTWYSYLFRDYGSVGRIPYLVPVKWVEGWPVLGVDGKVPETLNLPASKGLIPGIVNSDEFNREKGEPALPLVWQWNHNPDNNLWSVTDRKGYLRLKTGRIDSAFVKSRNTLTQRTFGPECSGSVLMDASNMKDGDFAGLCALQSKFGQVGVKMVNGKRYIFMVNAETLNPVEVESIPLLQNSVYLKIEFDFKERRDISYFYYSLDGKTWTAIGTPLHMDYRLDHFMGYRFGLFNYATQNTGGYADFDYFRINDQISKK